jgi:hypothetical protein
VKQGFFRVSGEITRKIGVNGGTGGVIKDLTGEKPAPETGKNVEVNRSIVRIIFNGWK